MSEAIIKKNGTDYPLLTMPNHYPADRVYLDGDTTKTVQDKCARKADLTNLDLTGTTNTTGSTISSGTYFYLNGVLVRAKTAIASGATFTENTNYEVVTIGDALTWGKIGDISLNRSASIDLSEYSEICFIPIINSAVAFNSSTMPTSVISGVSAHRVELAIFENTSYNARLVLEYANNAFTLLTASLAGWTSVIVSIYAR